MDILKKENKRKGIIGTILFHGLIVSLLLLPFMSLTYQDPPPPKKGGIGIKFGSTDTKKDTKKIDPSEESTSEESTSEESTSEESSEATKEIRTNKNAEEIPVNDDPPKDKEADKQETQKKEQEEINNFVKNKLNKDKKSNKKASLSPEEMVKEEGEEKGKEEGEGEGEGDNGYFLEGRKATNMPKPSNNQTSGIVTVEITVNKDGDVVYAKPGVVRTTITDLKILQSCKEAALETKFEKIKNIKEHQMGKIIYRFSLN